MSPPTPVSDAGRQPVASYSPRLRLALLLARLAVVVSRVLGRGGSVVGGLVLLRLVPDAVEQLSRGRTVLLVSGTNGKSTSAALLTAALRTSYDVASNADGANTPRGLAGALALAPATHVVLEVDEAWLPWAIKRTRPRLVCLLNLSRDQLHRNPEVHALADRWRAALAECPLVVANADDPAVTWAALAASRQIWVAGGQEWVEDSAACPHCGQLLDRSGADWSCTCGLARPRPDWVVDGRLVQHQDEALEPDLRLPGAANLANAAVALAAAETQDVHPADALAALAQLRDVAGRYAQIRCGTHEVRLILAKNPAGWQAALDFVGETVVPTVLCFNSEGVDGRDPSWLYDVDFTRLRPRRVAVCGRRGTDMSVRLRMDQIVPVGQYGDLLAALRALPPGRVDLIANYSAFQDARRVLARAA